MKNRLAKFLVGICLAIPCLSGCSLFDTGASQGSQSENTSSIQEGEGGGGQQGGSSQGGGSQGGGQQGGSTNVPIYNGDTSRTVGTINNVPTDHYSDATKAKITKMMRSLSNSTSDRVRDQIVDYMIELEIGEELASALCDSVVSMTAQFPKKSFNSRNFVDACYDVLTVLNSVDFSKVSRLLQKINEEYQEEEREHYRDLYQNITILSHYNPEIGSLYYNTYLELKNNKNNFNSQDLNTILETYDEAFSNYYFSPQMVANFESYKEGLLQADEEFYTIPQEYISFLNNHANDARDIFINDLKLIVDAYGQTIYDFVDVFSTPVSEINFTEQYGNNSYSYYYQDILPSDRITKLINFFLNDKDKTVGLINTILSDTRIGNLLLDFVLDFLIPQSESRFKDEPEALAEINQFKTRVSSLNGAHITAIVSFLMQIANRVNKDDLTNFIKSFFSHYEMGHFDYFSLGDKYVNVLDSVIASLTATQKRLIIETSQIFGFDLIAELQNASRIYKSKDVSTEEGTEAFGQAMYEWYQPIMEKLYRPFYFLFSAPDSYGYSDNYDDEDSHKVSLSEHLCIYFYESNYYVGDTSSTIQNGLDITLIYITKDIEYNYTHNSYVFSCYFKDIDSYVQRYLNLIEGYGVDQFKDYYGETTYLAIMELSEITLSDLQVSLDTSKCGNLPLTVSFKANGKLLTTSFNVTVGLKNMPIVQHGYCYETSGTSYSVSYNNNYSITPRVVGKNSRVSLSYYYGSSNDEEEYLDTSTTGWHYYFNYKEMDNVYLWTIYLVVDDSLLASHISYTYSSVGFAIEGSDSFFNTPYTYVYYEYEGLEIYKTMYLGDGVLSSGDKTANKIYQYQVNSVTFEYAIISSDSVAYTNYYFDVIDPLTSSSITTPIQVRARVYTYTLYQATIDGCFFVFGVEDYESNNTVTLTNFTFVDDVVTFAYAGKTFTFKEQYYY